MDLKKVLPPEAVCVDLAAPDKDAALAAMCRQASRLCRLQEDEVLAAVLERESLGSTGLGSGVALPHGRAEGLDGLFMILARTAPDCALDFGSPDGQPVRLAALLLSPAQAVSEHLKVLALLGRLWKSQENIRLLLAAPDRETFYNLFLELAAGSL
ncbi:MAG: PTS sugar transporter subunit IIA [Deltaproteobacteria bacterium]|jgi:PTS system nitrogen regulatory IIA component|nr:PTS sugar transporter subunit IIA [Deltaproteobacteria bacterium]